MLTIEEREHRDIVIKVLERARYSHSQAVAIATGYVLKLRKGDSID